MKILWGILEGIYCLLVAGGVGYILWLNNRLQKRLEIQLAIAEKTRELKEFYFTLSQSNLNKYKTIKDEYDRLLEAHEKLATLCGEQAKELSQLKENAETKEDEP